MGPRSWPIEAVTRRVRAPRLRHTWTTSSRWRLTYSGLWSEQEHINLLEMRTLVGAARHLARSRRNWFHKMLFFTDSMVCLGIVSKGRSSVVPFLRLCRQWCMLRIVLGMRFYVRHVPTDLNLADGPSRGRRIGA